MGTKATRLTLSFFEPFFEEIHSIVDHQCLWWNKRPPQSCLDFSDSNVLKWNGWFNELQDFFRNLITWPNKFRIKVEEMTPTNVFSNPTIGIRISGETGWATKGDHEGFGSIFLVNIEVFVNTILGTILQSLSWRLENGDTLKSWKEIWIYIWCWSDPMLLSLF